MIDRIKGQLHLICDICGEGSDETFDDFQEEVEFKKANGWKSVFRFDLWHDICPNCKNLDDYF